MGKINYIQADSGSIYEFLLIVLVVVLIYNGMLRNKILRNNQNATILTNTKPQNHSHQKVSKQKPLEREYIDFEIVGDTKKTSSNEH